ncbi:AraC family transcriptional regulator [Paenibacillus thalictri]|nr:AraC family transcriptional regulator [Paenibacillus thalictri]
MRDEQLKLLWTARIDYRNHSGVKLHDHSDFHQLLVVLEGSGTIRIGDQVSVLSAMRYYLLSERVPHEFLFETEGITLDYKFGIQNEQIKHWLLSQAPTGELPQGCLESLKRTFQLSQRYKQKQQDILPLAIDSLFKSTLLQLFMNGTDLHAGGSAIHQDRSFEMADYVHQHYTEPLSLTYIADHFRFHPHHVIYLFRKHTGVTPGQYIQQVRLERAKELLEFTRLSVTEIAEQLTWTLPYFSRLFRAKVGAAPAAYRETIRSAVGHDLILSDDFANTWRIEDTDG